jgi:hypothetical protein
MKMEDMEDMEAWVERMELEGKDAARDRQNPSLLCLKRGTASSFLLQGTVDDGFHPISVALRRWAGDQCREVIGKVYCPSIGVNPATLCASDSAHRDQRMFAPFREQGVVSLCGGEGWTGLEE